MEKQYLCYNEETEFISLFSFLKNKKSWARGDTIMFSASLRLSVLHFGSKFPTFSINMMLMEDTETSFSEFKHVPSQMNCNEEEYLK